MSVKKRFADMKHPMVQALLGGHYRFSTEEQAREQLAIIKSHYFISKHPSHPDKPDSCTFWIRGYDITDDEKNKGAQGNFISVHCVKTSPDQFGFFVKKAVIDLSVHPQRKRIMQRHPNWGHPILRSVEKKRVYPSVENAQAELTLLQQEYPHAAIPGPNKLYLMIFGRAGDDDKKRVKKYILEIKTTPQGGYVIDYALNDSKPPRKRIPPAAPPQDTQAKEPVGSFTAKLALKRNKKKK